MSRTVKTLAFFSLLLLLASCAAKLDRSNARHGRVVYRKVCGSCHAEGAKASPLDTRSKTMEEWARYFGRDLHDGSPGAWSDLSAEDLRDVRQYVNDYAGDTDPSKCGACWETH